MPCKNCPSFQSLCNLLSKETISAPTIDRSLDVGGKGSVTKVNIQNIKVDFARTSNGRYDRMASTDDRTSDCPIFGLDIILIYLLNVEHS